MYLVVACVTMSTPYWNGRQVDRSREGVVDDQWHAVTMRCVRELLEVEHDKRRIGDGLAEHGLGIRLERGLKLLFGAVRVVTKVHSTPILRMVTLMRLNVPP